MFECSIPQWAGAMLGNEAVMTSGGPRFRSGPSADPSSLRQAGAKGKDWITLPAEGFQGEIPAFPLEKIPVYDIFFEDKKRVKVFDPAATEAKWDAEVSLWEALWRKPQAVMWDKLALHFEVAAYVRAFIRANGPDGNASDRGVAIRMAAEIGLSLPGMHGFGWKFSEDELAVKRAASVADKGTPSARERWASIGREG